MNYTYISVRYGGISMKNNVKIIIAFILGLIIAGSIGVYATIKIQASEIGYKDTTVEATLNDLYTLAGKNISFGNPIYSHYSGDQLENSEITLPLNKGKYIVSAIYALANHSATYNVINVNNNGRNAIVCSSSNCNISKLGTYAAGGTPTSAHNDSYANLASRSTLYYVTIEENTDTINFATTTFGDRNFNRLDMQLIAVPVEF